MIPTASRRDTLRSLAPLLARAAASSYVVMTCLADMERTVPLGSRVWRAGREAMRRQAWADGTAESARGFREVERCGRDLLVSSHFLVSLVSSGAKPRDSIRFHLPPPDVHLVARAADADGSVSASDRASPGFASGVADCTAVVVRPQWMWESPHLATASVEMWNGDEEKWISWVPREWRDWALKRHPWEWRSPTLMRLKEADLFLSEYNAMARRGSRHRAEAARRNPHPTLDPVMENRRGRTLEG